jgi:hypothetical protein
MRNRFEMSRKSFSRERTNYPLRIM